MLQRKSMATSAALIFLFGVVSPEIRCRCAENPPEKQVRLKLLVSDSEIFSKDGLAYKVVVTNVSKSTIWISAAISEVPYACVIERKRPGENWQEIWDYPRGMKSVVPGPIQISPGETWAEYGQVFLTKGKAAVFDKAGKWELRGRIKTVIGEYTSDPIELTVKPWPKGDEPIDKRFEPFGQRLLDLQTIPTLSLKNELTSLCKQHSTGGIGQTLKLILAVESYAESGRVAGKAATWSEAFKSLSPGLDEVRHDQLVFLLGYGATKNKQWKDVAALVKEVKDESDRLVSLRGQLDSAIITGEYREP